MMKTIVNLKSDRKAFSSSDITSIFSNRNEGLPSYTVTKSAGFKKHQILPIFLQYADKKWVSAYARFKYVTAINYIKCILRFSLGTRSVEVTSIPSFHWAAAEECHYGQCLICHGFYFLFLHPLHLFHRFHYGFYNRVYHDKRNSEDFYWKYLTKPDFPLNYFWDVLQVNC